MTSRGQTLAAEKALDLGQTIVRPRDVRFWHSDSSDDRTLVGRRRGLPAPDEQGTRREKKKAVRHQKEVRTARVGSKQSRESSFSYFFSITMSSISHGQPYFGVFFGLAF